jgi:hypothetical protein
LSYSEWALAAPKTTTTFYKQMLEAFRKTPGNYKAVAEACNTSIPTARLLWNKGWKNHDWARPLKDVVPAERAAFVGRVMRAKDVDPAKAGEAAFAAQDFSVLEEQRAKLEAAMDEAKAMLERASQERVAAEAARDEAKTALAAAREEAAKTVAEAKQFALDEVKRGEDRAKTRMAELFEAARIDAAEVMAEEAQGSKVLRRAALQSLLLAAAATKYTKRLQDLLDTKMQTLDLSPRATVALMREMSRLAAWSARTWEISQKAERLRVGSPTEIVAIREEDVPLPEQERMARAFMAAVERRKQKGNGSEATLPAPSPEVTVVPGGNGVVH